MITTMIMIVIMITTMIMIVIMIITVVMIIIVIMIITAIFWPSFGRQTNATPNTGRTNASKPYLSLSQPSANIKLILNHNHHQNPTLPVRKIRVIKKSP